MGRVSDLRDKFKALPPKKRQGIVIGGGMGLVVLLALLVPGAKRQERPTGPDEGVVIEETRVGEERIQMATEERDLFTVSVQQTLETLQGRTAELAALQKETGDKLTVVLREIEEDRKADKEIHEGLRLEIQNAREVAAAGGSAEERAAGESAGAGPMRMEVFEPEADGRVEAQTGKNYILPSGSLASVTLLNGVEAPPRGERGPFPILMYVRDPFMTANGGRVPLQGCVVLGFAEGDLSSERVHVKLDRVSCVFPGGRTLDKPVSGFVNGKDGKFGLPGKLINRAGAKLATATLLGGAQGVSQAIGLGQTTRILTAEGTERTVFTGDILTYGASGAATSALNELITWYRRNLEQIFPVIEVLSGEKATVVIGQPLGVAEIESLVQGVSARR